MTDWIDWKGGGCPVSKDTVIEARLRNGEEFAGDAWEFDFRHEIMDDDIIAYRIIKESEA